MSAHLHKDPKVALRALSPTHGGALTGTSAELDIDAAVTRNVAHLNGVACAVLQAYRACGTRVPAPSTCWAAVTAAVRRAEVTLRSRGDAATASAAAHSDAVPITLFDDLLVSRFEVAGAPLHCCTTRDHADVRASLCSSRSRPGLPARQIPRCAERCCLLNSLGRCFPPRRSTVCTRWRRLSSRCSSPARG